MRINPLDIGTIHLIGIGGIGMSGIAEILHSMGHTVQGSDMADSANVQRLKKKGIKVFVSHQSEHVTGASIVVPSSAVQSDNPEVVAARKQGIPVIPRSEMLAELMRFKPAVAIAGTHGKTTTTSLVATLLSTGNLDPTIINGGILNALNSNARVGHGNWMVVEADESDGTFVKVPATIAVVTNIEPEHLDYYGSFDALKQSFEQFIKQIPFYGFSVLCYDHPEVRALLPRLTERRFITYGFHEEAMCRAINIRYETTGILFDVYFDDGADQHTLKDILLPMYGDHNISNALAAITVAIKFHIQDSTIQKALSSFEGVKRRFTQIGSYKGTILIDDYAHHPTEVSAVLDAARKASRDKVIAILQPHRFSRLKNLFEEFAACMGKADHIFILPVHAAGESHIIGVDHIALAKAVSTKTSVPVEALENEEDLAQKLAPLCTDGSYAVCMGAGSITKTAHALQSLLESIHT